MDTHPPIIAKKNRQTAPNPDPPQSGNQSNVFRVSLFGHFKQYKIMKKTLLTTLATLVALPHIQAQESAFDDLAENNGVFSNWIGSFTFTTDLVDGEGRINHAEHGPLWLYTEGQNV